MSIQKFRNFTVGDGLEFIMACFILQILLACVIGWAVSGILTTAGVLSDDPSSVQFYARTDSRLYVVGQTSWFILPYPGW